MHMTIPKLIVKWENMAKEAGIKMPTDGVKDSLSSRIFFLTIETTTDTHFIGPVSYKSFIELAHYSKRYVGTEPVQLKLRTRWSKLPVTIKL